jgi:hypothetical protein
VISERIETEFRTASGITDGKGHAIAGVVLITAGYSADGKYSHYFVSQVPLKVGGFLLPPGQYLLGWVRGQDSLQLTFYLAQSGKPVGQVEATRNLSITRVESFRIWPPGDKPLIQLGRFTFSYALAQNERVLSDPVLTTDHGCPMVRGQDRVLDRDETISSCFPRDVTVTVTQPPASDRKQLWHARYVAA